MNSLAQPINPDIMKPANGEASQWHAQLQLEFSLTTNGTRLVRSRHHGPLYVQRPFYPEGKDLAHVYLLHPPGGLVSGDCLQIDLNLKEHSKVLCTTPGAGRVYRAREDQCLQQQIATLTIADHACLEWFPQETIVYPGAHAALQTRIELAAKARFSGWEIVSLGLPACAEQFDRGQISQVFRITREGRPVLIEKLRIDGGDQDFLRGAAGMQSQPVSGLFVLGSFNAEQLQQIDLSSLRGHVQPDAPARCALTVLGDFVVLRYLGACSEQAKSCFLKAWKVLRPVLLERAACAPRIWST